MLAGVGEDILLLQDDLSFWTLSDHFCTGPMARSTWSRRDLHGKL